MNLNNKIFKYILIYWICKERMIYISKYNVKEFQNIIINITIIEWFIISYKQYIVYKTIIENILLNKSKIGIVNVIFGIDRAKLIDSFYFDLLLRIVEFYIINVKILFLLLFKNINKFDIYYNNIINIIIINKIEKSFLYIC